MNADPIFNVFTAVETVWAEVERLISAVPDAFSPALKLERGPEQWVDDWAASRIGCHFKVRGAVPGQRIHGQLLLAFDLSRRERRSSWKHGKSALLTCAYAPKFDEGWDVQEVLIEMDGQLSSSEWCDGCTQHFDGRVLQWGSERIAWNRGAWLFSVPLLDIDGHEALHREIVSPVLSLLKSTGPAENPLSKSNAVRFPNPVLCL